MNGSYRFQSAPGHLIRRAHQIAVAVFAQELTRFDVTPVQFAILNAVVDYPGIDQITVAQHVAFDAATIGSVIGRLERKGWLLRRPDAGDRRRKRLWLTDVGQNALAAMVDDVERVQARILSPLDAREKQQFLSLIEKLVTTHARDSGV